MRSVVFQSILRKRIRKLPKFLKILKIIQFYSILFNRVLSPRQLRIDLPALKARLREVFVGYADYSWYMRLYNASPARSRRESCLLPDLLFLLALFYDLGPCVEIRKCPADNLLQIRSDLNLSILSGQPSREF